MSCLKVDIQPIKDDLSVKCEKIGGVFASLRLINRKMCCALKAFVSAVSGLIISAKVVNTEFSSDIHCVTSTPSVSVGIICDVGLDTECYLQVLDGNLITIDGCFIKVAKG